MTTTPPEWHLATTTGDALYQTPPRNSCRLDIHDAAAWTSCGLPPPAGWGTLARKSVGGRILSPSAKREQTDELIQRICAPPADVHKLGVRLLAMA